MPVSKWSRPATLMRLLTILESRPDIRVVFTDVQMPGSMDGLKLGHAVRDRWPPVHIIATSGHYAFNKGDLPTGTVFLQKPYSQYQIASTLHTFTAPSGDSFSLSRIKGHS